VVWEYIALKQSRSLSADQGEIGKDAVAVVGLSCRLPLAPDPGAFWRLLTGGVTGVFQRSVKQNPGIDGFSYDKRGGLPVNVADFDAEFFGICAREAQAMDPRQLLALELGWEALEDAALVPAALRGTATGVFVGVATNDDASPICGREIGDAGHHASAELGHSDIANGLAHFLGLRGPWFPQIRVLTSP
jgi:acyl transferase domain-containing protein